MGRVRMDDAYAATTVTRMLEVMAQGNVKNCMYLVRMY